MILLYYMPIKTLLTYLDYEGLHLNYYNHQQNLVLT
jgi:hypothetical protein